MNKEQRWLLSGWTLVILLITTWPWSDFQGHSHWYHMVWIPFSDVNFSLGSMGNIGGNILLFIPIGLLIAKLDPKKGRGVFLLAIFLSFGIEWFQVYCHNHFPSMTDFVCNVAGVAMGAVMRNRVPLSDSMSY